jgi:hypothetical protein
VLGDLAELDGAIAATGIFPVGDVFAGNLIELFEPRNAEVAGPPTSTQTLGLSGDLVSDEVFGQLDTTVDIELREHAARWLSTVWGDRKSMLAASLLVLPSTIARTTRSSAPVRL